MKECNCGKYDIAETHILQWDGQPKDDRFKLQVEMVAECEVCDDGEKGLMFVEVISPVTSEGGIFRNGGRVHEIHYPVFPEKSDEPVCRLGEYDTWQEVAQMESISYMIREWGELVDERVKDEAGW
jgi:hypothetical protein